VGGIDLSRPAPLRRKIRLIPNDVAEHVTAITRTDSADEVGVGGQVEGETLIVRPHGPLRRHVEADDEVEAVPVRDAHHVVARLPDVMTAREIEITPWENLHHGIETHFRRQPRDGFVEEERVDGVAEGQIPSGQWRGEVGRGRVVRRVRLGDGQWKEARAFRGMRRGRGRASR